MPNVNPEQWMTEHLEKDEDTLEFKLEEVIVDFTEEICRLMEEEGIDRSELAERLGVSRAFITKILNGNPNLTLKTMMKLSMALNREFNIKMPPKGFATTQLYVSVKNIPYQSKPSIPWRMSKAVNDINYETVGVTGNVG